MNENEKTLHTILTASQTGTIVSKLSKIQGIPVYEAFRRFMKSKTYSYFRKYRSIESMLSDDALIDFYLMEEANTEPIN